MNGYGPDGTQLRIPPTGTPAYYSFLTWDSRRLEGIKVHRLGSGEPIDRPPRICEPCRDTGEVPNPIYHPEDALDGPIVPCPRCSPFATGDGLR